MHYPQNTGHVAEVGRFPIRNKSGPQHGILPYRWNGGPPHDHPVEERHHWNCQRKGDYQSQGHCQADALHGLYGYILHIQIIHNLIIIFFLGISSGTRVRFYARVGLA